MADYIENIITITGNTKDLDKIESSGFDFDKIFPTPKELSQKDKKGEEICQKNNPTKKEIKLKELWEKKFGYDNWYHWQQENWGVKCGASSISMSRSDKKLVIECVTPWQSPNNFLKALSKKYPLIDINLVWTPENRDYEELAFKNGECV